MKAIIEGTYKAKTRIFGITLWSKKGSFHYEPNLSDKGFSKQVGPVVLSASLSGSVVNVTAQALGFPFTLATLNLSDRGPKKFKAELDKANEIEGTVFVEAMG